MIMDILRKNHNRFCRLSSLCFFLVSCAPCEQASRRTTVSSGWLGAPPIFQPTCCHPTLLLKIHTTMFKLREPNGNKGRMDIASNAPPAQGPLSMTAAPSPPPPSPSPPIEMNASLDLEALMVSDEYDEVESHMPPVYMVFLGFWEGI